MNIEFPERPFRLIHNNGHVAMTAVVNGKDILCTIQISALTDIEPKNKNEDKEKLFNEYKSIYQSIAREKIDKTDGKSNIIITYNDVIEFH